MTAQIFETESVTVIVIPKTEPGLSPIQPEMEREKSKSAGLCLPPDLLKRLRKRAFDLEISKSRLTQEILKAYFKRNRKATS